MILENKKSKNIFLEKKFQSQSSAKHFLSLLLPKFGLKKQPSKEAKNSIPERLNKIFDSFNLFNRCSQVENFKSESC